VQLYYSTLYSKHSTLLYAALRCSTLLYAALRCSMLLYAAILCSTLLYAIVRCSTLLTATMRYSTLPNSFVTILVRGFGVIYQFYVKIVVLPSIKLPVLLCCIGAVGYTKANILYSPRGIGIFPGSLIVPLWLCSAGYDIPIWRDH
jgi:hypothetical protein